MRYQNYRVLVYFSRFYDYLISSAAAFLYIDLDPFWDPFCFSWAASLLLLAAWLTANLYLWVKNLATSFDWISWHLGRISGTIFLPCSIICHDKNEKEKEDKRFRPKTVFPRTVRFPFLQLISRNCTANASQRWYFLFPLFPCQNAAMNGY